MMTRVIVTMTFFIRSLIPSGREGMHGGFGPDCGPAVVTFEQAACKRVERFAWNPKVSDGSMIAMN